MNSYYAKWMLMYYFMIERSFDWCTTETTIYGNYIADILAVNKNKFLYEVEIKTSRADLNSELRAIKNVKNNNASYENKIKKHRAYLSKNIKTGVPSMFYFAVPLSLKEIALKGIEDTPYGLIVLGKRHVLCIAKRATKLHKHKISDYRKEKILSRLCYENMNMMKHNIDYNNARSADNFISGSGI